MIRFGGRRIGSNGGERARRTSGPQRVPRPRRMTA